MGVPPTSKVASVFRSGGNLGTVSWPVVEQMLGNADKSQKAQPRCLPMKLCAVRYYEKDISNIINKTL